MRSLLRLLIKFSDLLHLLPLRFKSVPFRIYWLILIIKLKRFLMSISVYVTQCTEITIVPFCREERLVEEADRRKAIEDAELAENLNKLEMNQKLAKETLTHKAVCFICTAFYHPYRFLSFKLQDKCVPLFFLSVLDETRERFGHGELR